MHGLSTQYDNLWTQRQSGSSIARGERNEGDDVMTF